MSCASLDLVREGRRKLEMAREDPRQPKSVRQDQTCFRRARDQTRPELLRKGQRELKHGQTSERATKGQDGQC